MMYPNKGSLHYFTFFQGVGWVSLSKAGFWKHGLSWGLAGPRHEIKVPGRIVGVDGKTGTAAELLSFMQEAEHDFEVEPLSYD